MLRRSMLFLPAAALVACGGTQSSQKPAAAGNAVCDAGQRGLADKLGPELAAVLSKTPIPDPHPAKSEDEAPPPPLACALVYTQVAEETASEDVPPDDVEDAGLDHQLAFAIPQADGKVTVATVNPSERAPGPVTLTVSMRDVVGDGRPALLVQEDRTAQDGNWRGLRIFTFAGGGQPAHEIFDEELKVKTPEGLEMVAEWEVGQQGGKRAIIVEGAGTKAIYAWDQANERFAFDADATAAVNPKPATQPAAAPASAAAPAPASAAAAPTKKKKGDKKAAPADDKIQIPIP